MRESSLDDFADGTADQPAAPSDTPDEAAIATYAWSPTETACDGCGTPVSRRWRDGDAFVCADCKEW